MGPNEPLSISFDLIIKSTHLLRGENTKKNKSREPHASNITVVNKLVLSGFFFFFPLQSLSLLPLFQTTPRHFVFIRDVNISFLL